jgi:hypothetical protein
VRLFVGFLLMVWSSGDLLGAFAQSTTSRSGFAVVTLVSGNIAGLTASETIKKQTSSGVEQAILAPTVLITGASMLVPLGPLAQSTTAIAIANPSLGSGGVNLVLTDAGGGVVLNVTVNLGPRGQFSKFLNEFSATQPAGFTTPLLLTISAEIPVGVVALNFQDDDFSSIPLTSLSFATPVPVQPLIPPSPSSPSSGFGLGLPPIPPAPIFSVPVTVSNSPVPTTVSIGGTASLVFPEITTGGDWSTDIAIGNTSAGQQSIRIDFFRSDGSLASSLTNIVIPALGVVFVSADLIGK